MDIIVCAKQVIDVSEIKIDEKTNEPILQGIDNKISDIDKNAMEAAVKIKEEHGGKITALSVGPSEATENIKELLAMGADEAVIIPYEEEFDYDVVTHILKGAIEKIGDYDLILCGEASIDLFSGQVGPRIAQLLDLPQITYTEGLRVEEEKVQGDRDLGDRTVTIESPYPTLVTVTKEINEPRLPSLMEILNAADKPIQTWDAEELIDEELSPKIEQLDLRGVSMERKNVIYEEEELDEAVEKLVENLAKDGVLG